jgi:protein involved in polysaccharide export with SLBB domain
MVGPSGTISLPLVGEVPAAGARTDELAQSISARLKERIGLKAMPATSVEVVQFRPFYILGKVEKPGEYPYRPDLSVLQAISIAGGLPRSSDPSLLRIGREIVSAKGSLNTLKVEIASLMARRARLDTEMAGDGPITFPKELLDRASDEAIARVMTQEQQILDGRRETMKSQAAAINDLTALLNKEIESLDAKLALKDRQLNLVRRELSGVETLVSKGLAVAPRQFSLERAEADIETSRLEIESALLRARQDVSRSQRDLIELRTKRRNDILMEIRDTQNKLDDANQRLATSQKLLAESEQFSTQVTNKRDDEEDSLPQFSIVRKVDGRLVETQASETDQVQPGDLVKVWIAKPPASAQASARSSSGTTEAAMAQLP